MEALWIFIMGFAGVRRCSAQHAALHEDYATAQDKARIDQMSRELLHVMQLQERQLLPLKLEHVHKIQYQVGLVIGIMREKYKRMMEIYGEMLRRDTGENKLTGPGVQHTLPLHYLDAMEKERMLEMEINNYVDLLLKIHPSELEDERDMNRRPQTPGMNYAGPGSPPHSLRMRADEPLTPSPHAMQNLSEHTHHKEEVVKWQLRERYLQRRGLDAQWTLDHYYGFP